MAALANVVSRSTLVLLLVVGKTKPALQHKRICCYLGNALLTHTSGSQAAFVVHVAATLAGNQGTFVGVFCIAASIAHASVGFLKVHRSWRLENLPHAANLGCTRGSDLFHVEDIIIILGVIDRHIPGVLVGSLRTAVFSEVDV